MGGLEAQMRNIGMGAWLHDIGKLAISDGILLKPGALTDEERRVMQQHAQIGYDLVKGIPFLAEAAEIIYAHHERWDGSGYPRGLTTEEIPVGARIFAVADTFDAMTDRKRTRLNCSHRCISYAVFCLKKKMRFFVADAVWQRPDCSDTCLLISCLFVGAPHRHKLVFHAMFLCRQAHLTPAVTVPPLST